MGRIVHTGEYFEELLEVAVPGDKDAGYPGQVFSRTQLLDSVWGSVIKVTKLRLSHINRLRGKIEPDRDGPQFIVTLWAVGYKLQVSPVSCT